MLNCLWRRHAAALLFLLSSPLGLHSAWSAAASNVPLEVVWPPAGVHVAGERIRVGGKTDPGAKVTVNGQPVSVFPSGAFAGNCPLKIGENSIVYRAAKGELVATATRKVTRSRPLKTSPKSPIGFDPVYPGRPEDDMEVRPGDTIRVRVKGSPGARATFRIGTGKTHYPLVETKRGSIGGFYEGAYTINPDDRFVQARISAYIAGRSSKSGSPVRQLLPAHITVNTAPYLEVVRVKEDFTELRAEPNGGAPLAMAREGTRLDVAGSAGKRLRIALGESLHGWIHHDQIENPAQAAPGRQGSVRNLTISESGRTAVIRMPLGERVPFAVTERPNGSALELTLFNVDNRLNWITDKSALGLIETVSAVPSADGTARFLIAPRQGRLRGYRGYYEQSDFLFAIHLPVPPGEPANPLAGRKVILDPGHGGPSPGTIGSTGVEEKTVNLTLCKILKSRLESRGASVVMTRDGDKDVSLADRARFAEKEDDACLFVSIHNNSISLTEDPLAARGVGVFYYQPHSRDLAQAVYRRMLAVEPKPRPYGVIRGDFFVCREITHMPSVLVECLFLSSPEDEMLLLDKAFVERYMEAVAAGIADSLTPEQE